MMAETAPGEEQVGMCEVCGCGPVPTYPTTPYQSYFDGSEWACHWCLMRYTPEHWGDSDE